MLKLSKNSYVKALLVLYLPLFIWSFIHPKSYTLWILEVLPAVVGIVLLTFNYNKIRFTKTTYTWCFIAACMVTIGSHYSYSEVPLFNWLKEVFNWKRNNYDKLGHFIQGIIPVLISYEVIIRKNLMNGRKWINFYSLAITFMVSSAYEIIEWFTVFWKTDTTYHFLGEQGYMWDAQTDMFFAVLGGLLTIIFSKKIITNIQKSANHTFNPDKV